MNLDFCNGCDGTGGCVPECYPSPTSQDIEVYKGRIKDIERILSEVESDLQAETHEGKREALVRLISYLIKDLKDHKEHLSVVDRPQHSI